MPDTATQPLSAAELAQLESLQSRQAAVEAEAADQSRLSRLEKWAPLDGLVGGDAWNEVRDAVNRTIALQADANVVMRLSRIVQIMDGEGAFIEAELAPLRTPAPKQAITRVLPVPNVEGDPAE